MTEEKPSLEELGKMSEKEIGITFDLPPHDARRLKETSSDTKCMQVLKNPELSVRDMAQRLGILSSEAFRRRHLLIKTGYATKKKNVVNERRSPERDRVIAYLKNETKFKCERYHVVSEHLDKSQQNIQEIVSKLKQEGRVRTVIVSRETIVYLPRNERGLGKYVTSEVDVKSLGRYDQTKLTRRLREILPAKSFETYHQKIQEAKSKLEDVRNK